MCKRQYLLIVMMSFLLGSITVNAETKKIDVSNTTTVNLIDMSNKLNEVYTTQDDQYLFVFNENSIYIEKDNPVIIINDEPQLIETENIDNIILPKYTTLNITENNVEFNYERFLEITNYKHDESGIQITYDDPYEIPEKKVVDDLDFNYIKTHIEEIGYEKMNEGIYEYNIFGITYNELVITDDNITLRINKGEQYQNNQSINAMIVETLLKCVDKDNVADIYNSYLEERDFEETTEKINVKITFTETEDLIDIQKK